MQHEPSCRDGVAGRDAVETIIWYGNVIGWCNLPEDTSRSMQEVNTRLLRSFLAVAAEQNVSQAAKRLGCSQGTMSLRIRKLEDALGLRLFHRARYNVRLTEAGQEFLPMAKTCIETHDRIFNWAQATLVSGEVRLGAGEECGTDWIPELLRRVSAACPNIQLRIRTGLGQDLRAGVETGELELAVVAFSEPAPLATVLSRPHLHWVAQPGFEFDRHPVIPVAWYPEGCSFRAIGKQALDAHGIAYREILESQNAGAIERVVQAGAGISVMAEGTVPEGLRVTVRPSLLPRLGRVCIQLLESAGPHRNAALAIKQEILGLYSGM